MSTATAQSLNFGDIKNSCLNLTSLAGSFEETISSTTNASKRIQDPAWAGEASTKFREKLEKLLENLPNAKQQLAMSVLFLTSCANGYHELGEDNVKKLKDLIGGQSYIDNYDVNSAPSVDLDSRYGQVTPQPTDTSGLDDVDNTDLGSPRGGNNYRGNDGAYDGSGDNYLGTGVDAAAQIAAQLGAIATLYSLTNLVKTKDTGKEVTLPEDVKQAGYSVSGYDYTITTNQAVEYEENSKQRKVRDIWKEQGAVFKNGIAVINVDGVDRYLISTTSKYGNVGDCIDVTLEDGTVIQCIIADLKGSDSGSEWGISVGNEVSILEFKVQREKYMTCGTPTTSSWGLDWNSDSAIKTMKNGGNIIGAQKVNKDQLTGATTTGNNNMGLNNKNNDNSNINQATEQTSEEQEESASNNSYNEAVASGTPVSEAIRNIEF